MTRNFRVPSRPSILRLSAKLKQNRSRNFWDIGKKVTSCHAIFGQKRRELPRAVKARVLNRFQSSLRGMNENEEDYKMAISDFQNFGFFEKYFEKSYLFWKFWKFSKIFKIFKKPEYMYKNMSWAICVPNLKSLAVILCLGMLNKHQSLRVRKIWPRFCDLRWPRRQKITLASDSWGKTESKTCIVCRDLWTLKIGYFYTVFYRRPICCPTFFTLTWPWPWPQTQSLKHVNSTFSTRSFEWRLNFSDRTLSLGDNRGVKFTPQRRACCWIPQRRAG